MAKSRKKRGRIKGGPYLLAAVICEKVLAEQGGVPSLIRIIDQITVPQPPANLPPEAVPAVPLMSFFAFRSGDRKGKSLLQLLSRAPSGKMHKSQKVPVVFE